MITLKTAIIPAALFFCSLFKLVVIILPIGLTLAISNIWKKKKKIQNFHHSSKYGAEVKAKQVANCHERT